ncbi:zeta toxin family protein [Aggregatibacter actinomycetemcomitans]|uniref:zeta toxin family protein n=1 Tax=Aggregatibacter actinomycetemcomitans TaxID=714 RepID=UPI00115EE84D
MRIKRPAIFLIVLLEDFLISIKKRVSAIYESTFGNIETARSLIEPFKNAGYTVLVIQLPVDMRLSGLITPNPSLIIVIVSP